MNDDDEMKLIFTLKDKIVAKVEMKGYGKEEHHQMLELLHQINERHKKSDKSDVSN
jgi:hypothetical protein